MSPLINIVIVFDPYNPLHFHAPASATATEDMAAMSTALCSFFIAIILSRGWLTLNGTSGAGV